MVRCPRCGRYMDQKIIYICGRPEVAYLCSCGYDSTKTTITYSNKTDLLEDDEDKD